MKSVLGAALGFAALHGGFAAAQPIVRPSHPRIFLDAGGRRGITPATLAARCVSPTSQYTAACRAATAPLPPYGTQAYRAVEHPLIALAARQVLYPDPRNLDAVRNAAGMIGPFTDRGDVAGAWLTNARAVRQLAVAYDWLYDSLAPSDRATLEADLRSYAEWSLAHEPPDVFSAEAYAHVATVGLCGLALAGSSTVLDGDVARYLTYASSRWKNQLLPALAYAGGWWHEGPGWFTSTVVRNALLLAAAWTTGTDEDLFAHARMHGAPFDAAVTYLAYVLRPDFRFAPFGDATDAQLAPAGQLRPVLDLLAWGTGSTIAQALALETSNRVPAGSDYNGAEAWQQLVFYAPERPAVPSRSSLPLAVHLGATTEDVVVMRSSWDDGAATWITLSCGDWFSTRQHLESGSLQVFHQAPLAVSTGTYDGFETAHWINWYAQRSAHASLVTITRPGEAFPNTRMLPTVNDGGERSIAYAAGGRRSVDEYRNNLTSGGQFETGSITAFETSRFHDYAACDATRAYNSVAYAAEGNAAKVREVTRQLVFLRPQLAVVFDRVEATDPAYTRRFVLHALSRPLLSTLDTFTIDNGAGRLLGRTLLPMAHETGAVAGFVVGDADLAPLAMGAEARGTRVEVTSTEPGPRDYFLHVLQTGDAGHTLAAPASRVEDGDRVGVRVQDPDGTRTYTVLFARTGAPGGTIRVTDRGGAALYEGSLGAGGTFYAPVTDAGSGPTGVDGGPDATTDAAAPGLDGGRGSSVPAGCACRSAPGSHAPSSGWTTLAAMAAMAGLSRGAARRRARGRR